MLQETWTSKIEGIFYIEVLTEIIGIMTSDYNNLLQAVLQSYKIDRARCCECLECLIRVQRFNLNVGQKEKSFSKKYGFNSWNNRQPVTTFQYVKPKKCKVNFLEGMDTLYVSENIKST